VEGIITRVKVYKNAGYFPPEDAQKIIDEAKEENVTVPEEILRRFVNKFFNR
jgi:GMP synthase (glutamine-hydrolysing)